MKKILTISVIFVLVMSLFSGCIQKTEVSAPAKSSASAPAPAASSADSKKQSITIRLGIGGPSTLPVAIAAKEVLVEQFGKSSDGHIKFEVYADSQLGDDVKAIESVRSGTLEMTCPTSAPIVGLVKEYAIFDTPFLFNDTKAAFKMLDGAVGQKIKDASVQKGVYPLGWGDFGFRNVTNSVRDIRKPEDIKGLKIRTMENPVHLAIWRALGANPTPMPVSEVFTAMQQHAIDGQENPISAIFGWKFHEVNKHMTLTGHVWQPMVYLFSKKVFDTYSAEDQAIIKEWVTKAALRSREILATQEADYLSKIKASGTKVIELTPEEKAAFRDATKSAWDLVTKNAGEDIMKMVQSELK